MTSMIEQELEGKEISAKVDLDDISEINTSRIWFTKEDVINAIQKAREELKKKSYVSALGYNERKVLWEDIEEVMGK